jgi:dTDP-4-dehydrorhamnose reductase
MIVITGSSGLLGACALESAVERGWEAIGLCHQHLIRVPAARVFQADLTDNSALRRTLLDLRPDTILHCAAASNVDWCEDHPEEARAINVHASAVLAEISSALNARLIYISTDSVFDGNQGDYVETDVPAPVNIYANSKLAGERATLERNPSAIIARVNIYGWNAQEKESLAEWVLRRLEKGVHVSGFTDVLFTPILVNDLVPILLEMLQQELAGIYHVTGAEKISKFEFARRVAATFGFDPEGITPCRVTDMKLRAIRPLDVSLCTGKIQTALGRSVPDVNSGLRRFRELYDGQYPQRLRSYLDGEKRK